VREVAIRAAVGASRWRIARQLLCESTLLALGAALLGVVFAAWGVDIIHGMVPPVTARYIAGWEHVGIDKRVLGFSAAAALLTALVAGGVPALSASRADLHQVLQRETLSASGGRHRRRLRSTLLVCEAALALLLAVCSGLLIRTFVHQVHMSYGFDPAQVLTLRVSLAGESYRDKPARLRYYDEALRRLSALPGAQVAGAISNLPLSGSSNGVNFTLEGSENVDARRVPSAMLQIASPGALQALRISQRAGRGIEPRDDAGAPLVALVSESLARRWFGSAEAAVGHRLHLGADGSTPLRTIVGVVGDVHISDLREANLDALWLPMAQQPQLDMALVLRTSGRPLALAAGVRAELLAIGRDQPIEEVRSMEQMLDDNLLLGPKMTTELLAAFALISLLLTMVGIYGVVAYSVAQRRQEIGIRLALGAPPARVVALIVRQGLVPVLVGIALGTAAALGATRGLQQLLIGVSPLDPLTFAAVPALLLLVAFFAGWTPARRAAGVDPTSALRAE
jgi:putative ABC transport system permease protein